MTTESSSDDTEGGGRKYPKTELLISAVGKILIPALIALVGWRYSSAIKQQEVGGSFVQLSLEILEEPPAARPPGLTDWAMNIVDEYSGVKLGADARAALRQVPLRVRRHVVSVTPSEEGSFSLKGIGSGTIRVNEVTSEGVTGLRIDAAPGVVIDREKAKVGDLFPLKWPGGGQAIVELEAIDTRTGEAFFSVIVPG